jgi:imidazoleglycerol-phosphate dehydratase
LIPKQPRTGSYARQTAETSVNVLLTLDGTGHHRIATGVLFLDHMLTHIARHGCFDVTIEASGDVTMDAHHTVEDVGIGLGRALLAALGEARGITRMAHAEAPMDEALVVVSVDLSGRPYAVVDFGRRVAGRLGDMDADLARHFMESLALEGRFNLHLRTLRGQNAHHIVEAGFKALARALDVATRLDERLVNVIPSTKGTLR